MQGHPTHLGGRRCALPPNPPPAFFFKVASSCSHTLKTEHKKTLRLPPFAAKRCKDIQCIWGGGAAPSPPTPLQLVFLKVASSCSHTLSNQQQQQQHNNNNNNNNTTTSQYHTDTEENCACILTRNAPAYGEEALAGGFYPNSFLLLHPLQPHTHSASIGLSQKTRIYRRKKRALDCVFCVSRAVAKYAHLPSQETRSGSCFLRRSVLLSQKTLINVQIYAPSGITWVTVAKNAPPLWSGLTKAWFPLRLAMLLGGSSQVSSQWWSDHSHLETINFGPTTRSSGDKNDHHAYSSLSKLGWSRMFSNT